ncbi:MAG: hypothetical protein AAF744_03105 [Pseudomonadota bacterium]
MPDTDQRGAAGISGVAGFDKTQVIAIAIGFSIVSGGLWLLYQSTGPYHPDGALSDGQAHLYVGD